MWLRQRSALLQLLMLLWSLRERCRRARWCLPCPLGCRQQPLPMCYGSAGISAAMWVVLSCCLAAWPAVGCWVGPSCWQAAAED